MNTRSEAARAGKVGEDVERNGAHTDPTPGEDVPEPAPESDEEADLWFMPYLDRLGGAARAFSPDQLHTIEEGVGMILRGLGEDPNREGLRDTPRRVARMYADLCSGHHFNPTTFANDKDYSEMVLVKDIQFYSLCEHHLMPWFGEVSVAYLPGERILGLSKLGRVVEQFARRLQLQERFTRQVAQALNDSLNPRGVAVYVSAEHLCMSIRGVRKPGHQTHTFTLLGEFQSDPRRSEFLRLCGGKQ